MFVNTKAESQSLSQKLAEIETDLGHQGNEYLFLRSIWRTHSHLYTHTVVDLDDQLDRLNKIVAMMKKHINYSAKKELYYQNNSCYDQIGVREAKILQAMSKASLEAEEFRTRLAQSISENEQLKKINQQLKQQIHELKKKRKQDTRTIKQLTQKTTSLQNRLLSSDYQSKSTTSFLRTSRNYDKNVQNDPLRQSLINISISDNLPKSLGCSSDRQKNIIKSKNRYSCLDGDQKWLNQASVIQDCLDQSILSVSSYGFFQDKPMHRIASQQENKENLEDSRYGFCYESERNLLKQKSLKKNRLKSITRVEFNGESPKQTLKFIRQNSKKTLLRKSQKLTQSALLQQAQ